MIRRSTVTTQMLAFRNGDEEIRAMLALPGGARRHPAIITIHEWWGLTDWMEGQTTRLAAYGCIVLAVDLYRGKVAVNRSQARKLRNILPAERAIQGLKAAFHYLTARRDVDGKRIGSIGWSMGGGFALQLAIDEPQLSACVVNYSTLPTNPVDVKKIKAPVLGNFGALDRGLPPAEVRTFELLMKSLNKSVNIKIYIGAGHTFQNPDNQRDYRPEASADSWRRILAFFAQDARTDVSM